jgi:UDP-N-acetylglucosamine/UDP-N-acetylgalactosamine diphosphorylase
VHHSLLETFRRANQGQVFAFFDQLSSAQQQALLAQAAEVDLRGSGIG